MTKAAEYRENAEEAERQVEKTRDCNAKETYREVGNGATCPSKPSAMVGERNGLSLKAH
jgi:hypothetical protein